MDINIESPNHFYLDLNQIAKSKDFSPTVRLLATDLITIGYVNIASFMENLSNDELQELILGIEENNDKAYENMILVSEMLAIGEGCDPSQKIGRAHV